MDLGNYIQKSMSYEEYWEFFEDLVKTGKTNWPEQTKEMIDYTKLNFQRSKRIHKQFKLNDDLSETLHRINTPITWLAITEPWCGDASQNLPVFHEIATLSEFIKFRLVLRDENQELMDAFLTDGSRSIPKVIQMDEDLNVFTTWGPRPDKVQSRVMEYKINPWTEKQKFYEEIQAWYNADKSMTLQNEILSMMKTKMNA